jgi:hypothetical protein
METSPTPSHHDTSGHGFLLDTYPSIYDCSVSLIRITQGGSVILTIYSIIKECLQSAVTPPQAPPPAQVQHPTTRLRETLLRPHEPLPEQFHARCKRNAGRAGVGGDLGLGYGGAFTV